MVRDLNIDVEVIGCPIIREEDGLAKSTRNTYLSPEERKAALVLSQSIKIGEDMEKNGETDSKTIITAMEAHINKEPLAKIDYIKIVDALSMQQIPTGDRSILCAMAVYIGKTRLIDNFIIEK